MIFKIFTIYDQKAGAYLTPFFLPRAAQAERTFKDCVDSDSHQFGQHPEDYTLLEIAEFDDSTATIDTHGIPVTIITGLQCSTHNALGANHARPHPPLGNEPPVQPSPSRGNAAE